MLQAIQNNPLPDDPAILAGMMRGQVAGDAIESLHVVKPFHKWVEGVILDGRPFTYKRHEYLIEPYQDTHPFQVELKATQLGLTSKAMLRMVYEALYRKNLRNVLYYFPGRSDVTDFSKGRVAPLVEENPRLIGKYIQNTDSANIKRIRDSFLYFRGMRSVVGMKSVPGDIVVFDELDEAPQTSVDKIMERMAHSEIYEVIMLSNPTMTDYGIDKAFQETDQKYWLLKCQKCNHYTDLVGTFPIKQSDEVTTLIRVNGQVIRACEKCHTELNPAVGEWVARRPDIVDKRGYQYSQLWSHYIKPKDILHKFRTTDNLTDFYNLKIGIAYTESENRLSVQDVLSLCSNYSIKSSDPGPCYMGVDQGKDLHVVIGKRSGNLSGEIVHLEIYKDFEELDRLMANFNVTRCVIDGLPETRKAREFAERFKGKVWLSYYNINQKGSYSWNEKEFIVQSNRTESLDASHKQITSKAVVLPVQTEIVKTFADQLHNVAKKLIEEETIDQAKVRHKTGTKRYIYIKLGPDHFRHAFNYETMARQFGAGFFGECDLT